MSRFFSSKYDTLEPYVPGEQPKDGEYIKLNTNESPFPPSETALSYAAEHARRFNLYSDPNCEELKEVLAQRLGIGPDELVIGNGSDEILNFAFMAFCDDTCPAYFPDVTYGFYKVFARLNGVPYAEIPLKDDLSLETGDYRAFKGTIFIANPNAPTGIALPPSAIEEVLLDHPDNIVVVDEAYVDFGAESCVPLIDRYDNLLVVQTFSKSRSMAGARLGFGAGNRKITADLETLRYSTNPYNVNSYTQALGTGVLLDDDYYSGRCSIIIENRKRLAEGLETLGFEQTPSKANFIFARHPDMGGEELYLKLKEQGILVRHFSQERIKEYNRITVGTIYQVEKLLETLGELLNR